MCPGWANEAGRHGDRRHAWRLRQTTPCPCHPVRPSIAAAVEVASRSSSSSPVAILATRTALPIRSAGRFSPRGPLGMRQLQTLPAALASWAVSMMEIRPVRTILVATMTATKVPDVLIVIGASKLRLGDKDLPLVAYVARLSGRSTHRQTFSCFALSIHGLGRFGDRDELKFKLRHYPDLRLLLLIS
jgi:hypothetical protein